MTGLSFNIDWTALWLALAFGILFYLARRWSRRFPTPVFRFSDVKDLSEIPAGWRMTFHRLPQRCFFAALASFLLAFIDPHFLMPKEGRENRSPPEPLEGIGIYLLLDQSGSMAEKEDFLLPDGSTKIMSKIDLLKQFTTQFVKGRPNDLIGLIFFARGAYIQSPLTLDHQAILNELKKFDVIHFKDQDATSIGYAIYKATTLIAATHHFAETLQGEGKPAYEIKSNIIVLVTDGFQEPSDLDKGKRLRNLSVPEAADYAKQQGVRVYIVNVEPSVANEKEYAPQIRQMEKAAASTNGKFFLLQGTTSLADIFTAIDKLEKSRLPSQDEYAKLEARLPKEKRPDEYTMLSLYPYLVALGMAFLFFALLLNMTLLRQAP